MVDAGRTSNHNGSSCCYVNGDVGGDCRSYKIDSDNDGGSYNVNDGWYERRNVDRIRKNTLRQEI